MILGSPRSDAVNEEVNISFYNDIIEFYKFYVTAKENCTNVFKEDYLKNAMLESEKHWNRIINHCVIESQMKKLVIS